MSVNRGWLCHDPPVHRYSRIRSTFAGAWMLLPMVQFIAREVRSRSISQAHLAGANRHAAMPSVLATPSSMGTLITMKLNSIAGACALALGTRGIAMSGVANAQVSNQELNEKVDNPEGAA